MKITEEWWYQDDPIRVNYFANLERKYYSFIQALRICLRGDNRGYRSVIFNRSRRERFNFVQEIVWKQLSTSCNPSFQFIREENYILLWKMFHSKSVQDSFLFHQKHPFVFPTENMFPHDLSHSSLCLHNLLKAVLIWRNQTYSPWLKHSLYKSLQAKCKLKLIQYHCLWIPRDFLSQAYLRKRSYQ